MSKSPWTWLLAAAALTLPFATTGCTDSCDELEELCDECPGELHGQCTSTLNSCELPASAGPVVDDFEEDCCDNAISNYEGQC